MEDVFVGSPMSSPVHTIGDDATLRTAALLLHHDIGSVVVVDDAGRFEGILTATDFVRVVADGACDYDPAMTIRRRTSRPSGRRARRVADDDPSHSGRRLARSATRATLPPRSAVRTTLSSTRESAYAPGGARSKSARSSARTSSTIRWHRSKAS